ncbi:MAG: FHA domain-containing protein [Gammaproteobacteria bacterium]|nr:FHA domain-containing protein [Gammaproteobacteria bacterium]
MAYILILGSGERCALNESQIGIGRAPDNEIALPDDAVSIYHAHIVTEPSENDENKEEYYIEDLGSTNKTYVNNKVVKRCLLKNGDVIRVGNSRLKFSSGEYVPPPPDLKKTQEVKKVEVSDFLYTKKT